MSHDRRPDELGAFLKARRADLDPDTVGLRPTGGRRRVPGLRREEVALLASISTDYYTRIEQGRIQASAPVLDTLARVLRLDDDQRVYLAELAGRPVRSTTRRTTDRPTPRLKRLLDDLGSLPGLVLGRRMDILAWNRLAAALIIDFDALPTKRRNYARLVFTEPAMRELYADWENVAHTCVSQLRMAAAHDPDDPRLAALVGELSVRDGDFRRWWAEHRVASRGMGTKVLRHPLVGELTLDWDTLESTVDSNQQLVVWSAEPGTVAHDRLRILASWSPTTVQGVSARRDTDPP